MGFLPRQLLPNYIDFEAKIEQNFRAQGPFCPHILKISNHFSANQGLTTKHQLEKHSQQARDNRNIKNVSYPAVGCNHKRIHFEKDPLERWQFQPELNLDIFERLQNYHLYQVLHRTNQYLHRNFLSMFFISIFSTTCGQRWPKHDPNMHHTNGWP